MTPTSLNLMLLSIPVVCLNAFGVRVTIPVTPRSILSASSTPEIHSVCACDLLGDLPTPSLLLELSLAEGTVNTTSFELDELLQDPTQLTSNTISLDGSLFVHTKVADTSERDEITKQQGSGKSQVICQVDASPDLIPGGAFLGIGLANHHVGGYYWARGMGIGSSLPAHGIAFRASCSAEGSGELYWRKRGPGMDAMETTEESSNSNDGKRSEWADFVAVGDTVQLVPENATQVLVQPQFSTILGVRRIGRPLGADPIVEKVWVRSETGDGWVAQ